MSIGIIPNLHEEESEDKDWSPTKVIQNNFVKLKKARRYLRNLYNEEFLATLVAQAADVKKRYKPKSHYKLNIGDLVILKEENYKPTSYPLGIVMETTENDIGEVTDVVILKGGTRERVRRHVTSLVPLLSSEEYGGVKSYTVGPVTPMTQEHAVSKPVRHAAQQCLQRNKRLFDDFSA